MRLASLLSMERRPLIYWLVMQFPPRLAMITR